MIGIPHPPIQFPNPASDGIRTLDPMTDPQGPIQPGHRRSLSHRTRWVVIAVALLFAGGGIIWWNLPSRPGPDHFLQLAEQALQKGQFAEATEFLADASKSAPDSARIHKILANLALQYNALPEAEKWISFVPPNDPDLVSLRLEAARKSLELAQVSYTDSFLQKIVSQNPTDPVASEIQIRLYQLTGREREIRKQIEAQDVQSSSRLNASQLCLYCMGGKVYGELTEPRIWLRRAIANEPRNNAVRAALGDVLIQSTLRDEARSILSDSTPNAPDSWRISLVQAEDLLHQGNAAEAAKRLVKLAPEAELEPRVWTARGRIASARKEFPAARRAFETAIQLNPFDPHQVTRLADLLRHDGQSQSSQEMYRRADLLFNLQRVMGYAISTPQDQKRALEEAGVYLEQLQFFRLSYLLYVELAAKYPDLTQARVKIAQLQKNPRALRPLSAHEN